MRISHRTHQKDLNSTKDVHGSSKCGTQIKTQSYSSSKLWAQRPRDHVIGSTGCGEKTKTWKILLINIYIAKHLNKWFMFVTADMNVC